MRHASLDGVGLLVAIIVGLMIVAAVGYAMCRVMGLEKKAFTRFAGTILFIVLAFLMAAQLLTLFFRS